jgi:hypothetical protein
MRRSGMLTDRCVPQTLLGMYSFNHEPICCERQGVICLFFHVEIDGFPLTY